MFTSFLSHLDWLSVGTGAIAGMAIFSVVSVQLSKKIKRQVSEQQQQLLLLQRKPGGLIGWGMIVKRMKELGWSLMIIVQKPKLITLNH